MTFDNSDSIRNANPLKYLQEITFPEPMPLELGETLPEVRIAYETYGQLNARKTVLLKVCAVLVCHALSGDSHADLAIARMLGHITYLSRESMMRKFDATRRLRC